MIRRLRMNGRLDTRTGAMLADDGELVDAGSYRAVKPVGPAWCRKVQIRLQMAGVKEFKTRG